MQTLVTLAAPWTLLSGIHSLPGILELHVFQLCVASNFAIRPVLIHIWERGACELHSTAVACPSGLDRLPVLTWQPNGRHLYSTAVGPQLSVETSNITPNSSNQSNSQVLLYERNGLEHGGFSLPDTGVFLIPSRFFPPQWKF